MEPPEAMVSVASERLRPSVCVVVFASWVRLPPELMVMVEKETADPVVFWLRNSIVPLMTMSVMGVVLPMVALVPFSYQVEPGPMVRVEVPRFTTPLFVKVSAVMVAKEARSSVELLMT